MTPEEARATLVVGIAGPSCSGKTTVARLLVDRLSGERCALLGLDHYYRDLSHLTLEARARTNFDAPAAIEHERVLSDLRDLLAGRSVAGPTYDFTRHERAEATVTISPVPVIVVEGTLALYWPELRALLDVRVYIDCAAEECLRRRLKRDVVERGRTEASVLDQWRVTVWPMHERYVLPTRRHADIVLTSMDEARAVRLVGDVVERRLSGSEGVGS